VENQNEIKQLFEKYLRKETTPEETERLLTFFHSPENKDFSEELIERQFEENKNEVSYESHQDVLNRVYERLDTSSRKSVWHSYYKPLFVAASLIVVGFLVYYKLQPATIAITTIADIKPGGNKATLQLANGKVIQLDDQVNGLIGTEAGVKISKTSDGQLVYTVAPESGNTDGYSTNTITTPNGGQYQVNLPDGSKVWLNAASTLTYATSLREHGEDNRRVTLSGEAYFEIAKDKAHPFIVKTATQEVRVLGTHFNVNSYADEKVVTTTLEEGSVQVSALGRSKVIKPGEQVLFDGKELNARSADLQTALAWKNGRIYFRDADIETIMRQVSRWYDVEVVYKSNIPERIFNGGVSRKANLSEVLKILELNDIHFKLENQNGRKRLVLP